MSFSSSSTSYEFRLLVEASNGSTNEGVFTLTANLGFDDSFALAALQALNGLPWPAGVTAPFTLTKRNSSEADYTGNLTTNPPSFT